MWEDIAINDKWETLNRETSELQSELQKMQAKKDSLAKKSVDSILDKLKATYVGRFYMSAGMALGANMEGKAITFITEVSVYCGPHDKFPEFNIHYETLILRDCYYSYGCHIARYFGNDKISFLETLGDEISKDEALKTIYEWKKTLDAGFDKITKRIDNLE